MPLSTQRGVRTTVAWFGILTTILILMAWFQDPTVQAREVGRTDPPVRFHHEPRLAEDRRPLRSDSVDVSRRPNPRETRSNPSRSRYPLISPASRAAPPKARGVYTNPGGVGRQPEFVSRAGMQLLRSRPEPSGVPSGFSLVTEPLSQAVPRLSAAPPSSSTVNPLNSRAFNAARVQAPNPFQEPSRAGRIGILAVGPYGPLFGFVPNGNGTGNLNMGWPLVWPIIP